MTIPDQWSTSIAEFVGQVEHECADLPNPVRRRLLSDLEVHLQEMVEHDQPLASLGSPSDYARELRAAMDLPEGVLAQISTDQRRRFPTSARLAIVLLIAALVITVVTVILTRGTPADRDAGTARRGPSSSTVSTSPAVTTGNDVPTTRTMPIKTIRIPITHVGKYSYTSPILPIFTNPQSISTASKFVGGTVTGSPRAAVETNALGEWVVQVDITVASFTGKPIFEVSPPVVNFEPPKLGSNYSSSPAWLAVGTQIEKARGQTSTSAPADFVGPYLTVPGIDISAPGDYDLFSAPLPVAAKTQPVGVSLPSDVVKYFQFTLIHTAAHPLLAMVVPIAGRNYLLVRLHVTSVTKHYVGLRAWIH